MAVRNIAVTDTLEKFRTEFNALCASDFGDIANLDASLSATNLIDAMNETLVAATNTAGFRIEDSSSTQQLIAGGNILRVLGTSNEIEAVVSATDTLTIGLPSAVSITTSLTSPTINAGGVQISGNTISVTDSTVLSFGSENLITTGTITAANFVNTGTTTTLGTIEISGNTIRSVDSTEVNINDGLIIQGTLKSNTINPRSGTDIDFGSNNLLTSGSFYTSNGSGGIIFEGSTPDGFETTIAATDPTADRTITIPNETGTLITTGSIDAVTEDMMANDSISSAELKAVVQLVIYNSSGVAVKTLYGAGS